MALFSVLLGLSWGLLVARRVWIGPRLCPKLPLHPRLAGGCAEKPVYASLFALLAALALGFYPRQASLAFVALAGWSCLVDWTRFRPFLYQNSALLLLLVWQQNGDGCRLLLCCVYFWAGVLKLNRTFVHTTYPWIVKPLLRKLPVTMRPLPRRLGRFAPLLEAAIGPGLLFPATRPLALLAAGIMHGWILACFSAWGHRGYPTIWPWNIAMLLTAVSLFGGESEAGPLTILGSSAPVLLLFGLLPALGLLNRLDPVLSHAHMSGRQWTGALLLSHRLHKRLPAAIQGCCESVGWGQARAYVLDFTRWYLHDLGVPAPQQPELLKAAARWFARYDPSDSDLRLTLLPMPAARTGERRPQHFSWSELKQPRPPAHGPA